MRQHRASAHSVAAARAIALSAAVQLLTGCAEYDAASDPGVGERTEALNGTRDQSPEQKPSAQAMPSLDEWRASMVKKRLPGKGCFRAAHPDQRWESIACGSDDRGPLVHPGPPRHRRGTVSAETVGAGTDDFAAQVSGTITSAVGDFPFTVNVLSETNVRRSGASTGANNWSLQLNTNPFFSSACSSSPNPEGCRGWQQFVYGQTANGGQFFIQYWLLNYFMGQTNMCPAGRDPITGNKWTAATQDGLLTGSCYISSNTTPVAAQPLSNLKNVRLFGGAWADPNADDEIIFDDGTQMVARVDDSMLGLGASTDWIAVEFNIFGGSDGSEATFNDKATITVRTSILTADGSMAPPHCLYDSFTGETNNLTVYQSSCCPTAGAFGVSWPAITFYETRNGTGPFPYCAPSTNSLIANMIR